jgi:hypothetical protein
LIRAQPDGVVEVPTASIAAPRRHSIRASLIALVGACLTPALLVSGYVVHENYTQHRARLERDAVLQARSLAAALDREFSGVVSGLRVLSTSSDLAAGELRAFHERARGALAFQIVDNYVMTDRQGRLRNCAPARRQRGTTASASMNSSASCCARTVPWPRRRRCWCCQKTSLAPSPRPDEMKHGECLHCAVPDRGRSLFGGSRPRQKTWPRGICRPSCGGASCDPVQEIDPFRSPVWRTTDWRLIRPSETRQWGCRSSTRTRPALTLGHEYRSPRFRCESPP